MFPKVHKEGSPGRPVVSSIICHTIRISKHIDHQLQPHVKKLKPHVKASTDFMRKTKASRSSRPEVFCKKGVLRSFTKFTGKHLWQSLAQVFSCEFCQIFKNTFFHRTPLLAVSEQGKNS